MADTEPATKQEKKKLPTIAIVGIGCVGLLVLAGIIMTVAGKVIFSKIGGGLLQKGIESKTGVKMDLDNKDGSMSFTDSETGQEITLGEQKLPDNFPSDFPIYPGAKPAGTMSGNNNEEGSVGYWVIFNTDDPVDAVKTFYNKELVTKGWEIKNTMTMDNTMTWNILKGTLGGTLAVGPGDDDKGTAITVMLGTEQVSEE